MKNNNYFLFFTIIATMLVSCAEYHKVHVSYKLANAYKNAQSKLDNYYKGRKINFTLYQDGISPESYEMIKDKEHIFTLFRHAPDIGRNVVEKAKLTRMNSRSCNLDVETSNVGVADLEKWITSNLNVTSISSQKSEP